MGISAGSEKRITLAFWHNLFLMFDNLINQNNKNSEKLI
jgi:hypothetical protein